MTLPFLIVFFAEKCVNSHKTFSVGFVWGEGVPVRGDDDELVLVRLYSSSYSSQVPTFSFGQRCSVLYVVLMPTI